MVEPWSDKELRPENILEVVKRAKEDDVAMRIVHALDGTEEEDRRVLLLAAEAYGMFLFKNIDGLAYDESPFSAAQGIESNLQSALYVYGGQKFSKYSHAYLTGENYPLDGSEGGKLDDDDFAALLDILGEENLSSLAKKIGRSNVVERHKSGVVVHVSESQFVEVALVEPRHPADEEVFEIRRVIVEDGRPITYSKMQAKRENLGVAFAAAADFARPLHPDARKRKMVGFDIRKLRQQE